MNIMKKSTTGLGGTYSKRRMLRCAGWRGREGRRWVPALIKQKGKGEERCKRGNKQPERKNSRAPEEAKAESPPKSTLLLGGDRKRKVPETLSSNGTAGENERGRPA